MVDTARRYLGSIGPCFEEARDCRVMRWEWSLERGPSTPCTTIALQMRSLPDEVNLRFHILFSRKPRQKAGNGACLISALPWEWPTNSARLRGPNCCWTRRTIMRWHRPLGRASLRSNWRAKHGNDSEGVPRRIQKRVVRRMTAELRAGQDPIDWREGVWIPENGVKCAVREEDIMLIGLGKLRWESAAPADPKLHIRRLRSSVIREGMVGTRHRRSPGTSAVRGFLCRPSSKPPRLPPAPWDDLGPD